jgi:hypothetical protein
MDLQRSWAGKRGETAHPMKRDITTKGDRDLLEDKAMVIA